jgi:hypothetical protein
VLDYETGELVAANTGERDRGWWPWQQRVQLFHQGVPPVRGLLSNEGRAKLADAELSSAGYHLAVRDRLGGKRPVVRPRLRLRALHLDPGCGPTRQRNQRPSSGFPAHLRPS